MKAKQLVHNSLLFGLFLFEGKNTKMTNWYSKYVELLHSGNKFCEEDLWKGQSLGRMPF